MEKIWLKNYESGVNSDIDLNTYESISEILETAFDKYADKPAYHCMGKTITYKELRDQSETFASFLQNKWGLKKGDRVALMMPNILQYPIALFGILRAGMIAVNINPLYTQRELESQLIDSGAKAIVIFANSAHNLEKIITKTECKHVVVTGIGDLLGFPKAMIVNFAIKYVKRMVPRWRIAQAVSFTDILKNANQSDFHAEKLGHDDIAFLQYTGGTTGVSKGAILTHKNIIANILQAKEWIKNAIVDGEEIIMTPLPLYHIFSLTANCLLFSSIGSLSVLITNPRDIPNFVKELKKWKMTTFTGVNTLFNALVNDEEFKSVDFSHLRVTLGGGMAVQKAVAEEWKNITHNPIIEAYGLTETSPAACINPLDLEDFNGYIGVPIPSTEVAIKDDAEKNLAYGEVGELCIKGPQVMQGYWNKPEETAKVMTSDGYFRTGDLGFMNEQGYVKIVDRKKDMILVSGFNVYPNEIEEIIVTHDDVLECAAVGVPDVRSGEAVKVFIVRKSNATNEDEMKTFCRTHLTGYKVPKYFEFRDELPKSNVGKILRKDLRKEA